MVDLLVTNIGQLVTVPDRGGPQRGAAMGDLGLIRDGAVAIRDGLIVAVGQSADLARRFTPARHLDAHGRVVCPGFVDCHTHAVWGGDRLTDFERRMAGATYQEIMAAGGGIVSTMQATRATSADQLAAAARARLDDMRALGTTTVEIKTGYGLDLATELKMLAVIADLARDQAADIVPTLLAAHTVPPEYRGDPDGYIAHIIADILPAAAAWYADSPFPVRGIPCFIDVFCEEHAFDLAQSERLLQAGLGYGFRPKIHSDQFTPLGGTGMAVRLGAVSADHLDVTPPHERQLLARSATIAVLLPAVALHLDGPSPDAREWLADGAALALATDLNPGSAPCPSLPLVMALACRYNHLTPAQALVAVTLNAAYAVGLGQRLGSIAPGRQADLLLLESDDYRDLAYWLGKNCVATVIKAGSQ
jgi:imidazolonepropionase